MPAQAPSQEIKANLFNMNRLAMENFVAALGEKPYRAKQILKWLYERNVRDIDSMTDISKALRARLAEVAVTDLPKLHSDQISDDGTCKWLFQLDDGNSIETVYIPEKDRGTLCVSSQVGCALDCSFCATARQGFNRNLSTAEIIGQVWLATNLLAGQKAASGARITNIVMMGMGEPLANYKQLVPALELMMDDLGYGLSKRRVTVSTSGVIPSMHRLIDDIDVSLAVSLHAANDDLRDELVPINRKYPIKELMAACWKYVGGERKRKILFEYVMLEGVNDQPQHARELVRLLRDFPGKVNLIPFNPFPGSGYKRSSPEAIKRFAETLIKGGVLALTRTTRGDDIDAACGQLAGDVEDKSRRYVRFTDLRFGEQAQ